MFCGKSESELCDETLETIIISYSKNQKLMFKIGKKSFQNFFSDTHNENNSLFTKFLMKRGTVTSGLQFVVGGIGLTEGSDQFAAMQFGVIKKIVPEYRLKRLIEKKKFSRVSNREFSITEIKVRFVFQSF